MTAKIYKFPTPVNPYTDLVYSWIVSLSLIYVCSSLGWLTKTVKKERS